MFLKYGEVYDLNIEGENCKGIYLGSALPRKKLKLKYVMLINKEMGDSVKSSYYLIRFNDYRFDKDNKLILQRMREVI